MPGLPEPRQCRGFILRVNVVDLLTSPFVKCADWNNATLGRIHFFPKWTAGQPIAAGIESVKLRVGPVAITIRVWFDQKRPDAWQQIPVVGCFNNEFPDSAWR